MQVGAHLLFGSPSPPLGFFMLVRGPPPQPQARYLTRLPQSPPTRGFFFCLATPISLGPCPAFSLPCRRAPGLTRSPRGEKPLVVESVGSEELERQFGPLSWAWALRCLPRAWRAAGCRGLRPTHLLTSSQPTLQQDSQEGDGGQKSHLVLHGACWWLCGARWCVTGPAAELLSAQAWLLPRGWTRRGRVDGCPRPFAP